MKFRFVFWDVLSRKRIVDNYITRQYISEDKSELQLKFSLTSDSFNNRFSTQEHKYFLELISNTPEEMCINEFLSFLDKQESKSIYIGFSLLPQTFIRELIN
jgi:hypothetical protein